MPEQYFDPDQPSYYRPFFGFSNEETPYEADWQDDNYGEYIQLYGQHFDVYLCTEYNPKRIFGEDPLKKYEADPFVAFGIFDVTPESLQIGNWEKLAEQETIVVYFHKTTIKESIKKTLIEGGFITDVDTFEDDADLTFIERHRRELQEGDIIRLAFNNIFYEIADSIPDSSYRRDCCRHHLYGNHYPWEAKLHSWRLGRCWRCFYNPDELVRDVLRRHSYILFPIDCRTIRRADSLHINHNLKWHREWLRQACRKVCSWKKSHKKHISLRAYRCIRDAALQPHSSADNVSNIPGLEF